MVYSSREIIEQLLADFDRYLNYADIAFEGFRLDPIKLEVLTADYGLGRVAIYESSAQTVQRVNASVPSMANQFYGVDISVQFGLAKDNQDNAEFIALDIKDSLIGWVSSYNSFTSTGNQLLAISFDSVNSISRNDKWCTISCTLSTKRDILNLTS
jgi:hypothetical protein